MQWKPLIAVAAAWVLYGLLHSVLAAPGIKRTVAARWPRLRRWYRLGYNIFAIGALIPVLVVGQAAGGDWLWRWTGAWAVVANAAALAAVAGFIWTLRFYDMRQFMGLADAPDPAPDAEAPLIICPAHRLVRHPWYSLALVVVWTRDMTPAGLVSALAISAYLWIGSRFEERKLEAFHGAAYARYRERVPALFPRPWRVLSAADAERLAAGAARGGDGSNARR